MWIQSSATASKSPDTSFESSFVGQGVYAVPTAMSESTLLGNIRRIGWVCLLFALGKSDTDNTLVFIMITIAIYCDVFSETLGMAIFLDTVIEKIHSETKDSRICETEYRPLTGFRRPDSLIPCCFQAARIQIFHDASCAAFSPRRRLVLRLLGARGGQLRPWPPPTIRRSIGRWTMRAESSGASRVQPRP